MYIAKRVMALTGVKQSPVSVITKTIAHFPLNTYGWPIAVGAGKENRQLPETSRAAIPA